MIEAFPAPSIVPLEHILPDEPLLMMGAGPVPIPQKVAAANSIVINHLGETMNRVIEQVKDMSRYVFQTSSSHVMGVSGPGSAAMEMAIANLVTPGSRVLCITNGYFSQRLAEMARRVRAEPTILEAPRNERMSVEMVERELQRGQYDVVTLVQGETSNTVCNTSLDQIARTAKRYGCMVIVDAVCTLSTMPLEMDNWQVDAIITGGQKGLSSIPGVSLLAFSEEAWAKKIARREELPFHWCLDAQLADKFWNQKSYHYTAPVSGILALHEALRLVCEETLPQRFERHQRCSEALQAGIETMGLGLLVEKPHRLNSVVGIVVPDHVSADAVRAHMSKVHKVEISGAFGLNILRIGQMGEQSRAHNLFRTLHSLGSSMRAAGADIDLPSGMAELERKLSAPR
ncbi:MAG TPA: alanine--glyoxylate aminotransferase family protein [Candidatus Thiothrix moscowensis]|uniref:pyridoxal-phosphate-dependent aminotransferase family protein n=1 Tax=unclassified Thiothrix TaxID=2636184 RepID=UPI0025DCD02B|nr:MULTISPECIES: alanine--glyoxylate aminotransferase family protein [unclassified Thiothrix]HRJ52185.1 alanine--glyoxylate aminotransferase family protein [Candidatus Thiothrix moscowensis]HRJ92304.1 alanine--glyoxylate aminotransferase family protein [Candidatus Thiothrix moscowensis]